MADFFEKMKDSINKGVATVSTGSKNMFEKSKINTFIKTLEDEKRQLTEIIGNKVFNFVQANPEGDLPRDEFTNLCEEITKRNEQIELQKQKLRDLDAEMNQVRGNGSGILSSVCSCGHENTFGAKFCAKCGNKLS